MKKIHEHVRYNAPNLFIAKYVAKTWRLKALRYAKIHIRRGRYVSAHIEILGDLLRFISCGIEEQQRTALREKVLKSISHESRKV